jgi:hypothetical protein
VLPAGPCDRCLHHSRFDHAPGDAV